MPRGGASISPSSAICVFERHGSPEETDAEVFALVGSPMLASTGATVGTVTVGTWPDGVAFDGANVWVVNENSNSVTKMPAF